MCACASRCHAMRYAPTGCCLFTRSIYFQNRPLTRYIMYYSWCLSFWVSSSSSSSSSPTTSHLHCVYLKNKTKNEWINKCGSFYPTRDKSLSLSVFSVILASFIWCNQTGHRKHSTLMHFIHISQLKTIRSGTDNVRHFTLFSCAFYHFIGFCCATLNCAGKTK